MCRSTHLPKEAVTTMEPVNAPTIWDTPRASISWEAAIGLWPA